MKFQIPYLITFKKIQHFKHNMHIFIKFHQEIHPSSVNSNEGKLSVKESSVPDKASLTPYPIYLPSKL